ncbi:MAG: MBL fold metallo-hydrolase, partial [Lentisphaerae bacterium]|nr:MBL fold metallo-hydrolase [Lentisphaerota bacterium]
MDISILASGSSGNSTYVEAGGVKLLIDLGITLKDTASALQSINRQLSDIDAILCTHHHGDHSLNVASAFRRHNTTLLANGATADAIDLSNQSKTPTSWALFETGATFPLGNLKITSFSLPHDASDTVGYVIDDGTHRLGICTDLGYATAVVKHRLTDCDALILEFNHDVELLMQSSRPPATKRRIIGRNGHLSNEDAATLLTQLASPRLQIVFAAHLSQDCNTPLLATNAARAALDKAGCPNTRLIIAPP